MKMKIVAVMTAAALTLALTACGGSTDDPQIDAQVNAQTVTDACHNSIKNQLKDPESAQFTNEDVNATPKAKPPADLNPVRTDHYYIVIGAVNAKNEFGGYTGAKACGCDAVLHKDGSADAIANIIDPDAPDTDAPDTSDNGS